MESLPPNLVDSLPAEIHSDAAAWWQGLTPDDRDELVRLCDARKDVFLFETFSGEDRPKVTGGKFIPHDDAWGLSEWGADYFQHLLDHPELMIVFDPTKRTFHIGCSRHREARRCFATGELVESFVCPFEAAQCLMHALLAGRKAVKLRPIRQG